jgi:hypothetical protein
MGKTYSEVVDTRANHTQAGSITHMGMETTKPPEGKFVAAYGYHNSLPVIKAIINSISNDNEESKNRSSFLKTNGLADMVSRNNLRTSISTNPGLYYGVLGDEETT